MGTTYKQAGVDIDAGNLFTQMIKAEVNKVWPEAELGGFADGGTIPKGAKFFKASVDGVGTKTDLARRIGRVFGVGVDAVAMSAVDAYVSGIRPTALYDYLVVEQLVPEFYIDVIRGLIRGCLWAGCYLAGGETAEHPGVGLPKGYFDLATFCIGFPDKKLRLNPRENIRPGMPVWGWLSYGLGSSGYSLARRVFKLRDDSDANIKRRLDHHYRELSGSDLADVLLRPTAIHIYNIEARREEGVEFIGHAHITGGGMVDNIPRILPDNCAAEIDVSAWQTPSIFTLIQNKGNVSDAEMRRTFNMGIQLVSVTPADAKIDHPDCKPIGRIRARNGDEPQVDFINKPSV